VIPILQVKGKEDHTSLLTVTSLSCGMCVLSIYLSISISIYLSFTVYWSIV